MICYEYAAQSPYSSRPKLTIFEDDSKFLNVFSDRSCVLGGSQPSTEGNTAEAPLWRCDNDGNVHWASEHQ
jgi:hypothetical protein